MIRGENACPSCGKILKERDAFCRGCGAKIESQVVVGGDSCVKCGVQLKPDARFCMGCGAKVEKTTVTPAIIACTNCGIQLKPDARFCKGCGTQVVVKPEPEEAEVAEAEEAEVEVAEAEVAEVEVAEAEVATTITCTKCGKQLESEDKFCKECGTPVKTLEQTIITCTKCGKQLESEDKFCKGCGTPIASAVTPVATSEPTIIACTNCGRQLKPTDKFCTNCATPTMASVATPVATTASKATGLRVREIVEFFDFEIVVKMGPTPVRIGDHHPVVELDIKSKSDKENTVVAVVSLETQNINSQPIERKQVLLAPYQTQTVSFQPITSNNPNNAKDTLYVAFGLVKTSTGFRIKGILYAALTGVLMGLSYFKPCGKPIEKFMDKRKPEALKLNEYEFNRV